MLAQIIRKEILEHLMSLRFAIACVLCFIVILTSLFVRCQDYLQVKDDYHENVAMATQACRNMDNPYDIIWGGLTLHQPPSPLKIFVRGTEDINGLTVHLNARQQPQLLSPEIANPLTPLFSAIDLVNFVGIIMSLLAIVFAYDAVCGEKERGTLRLMLSYAVPRDTVLLAKWIGGYVALIIPFLLAMLAAMALVLVQPRIEIDPDEWGQIILLLLLALLYIAAVYSAALWISCLTSRAATSIMVLVTLWLVIILAAPNLSPYVAKTLQSAKSDLAMRARVKEKTQEVWRETVDAVMDKYDKAHGFGKPWWKGLNWSDPETRKKGNERRLYSLDVEQQGYLAQQRVYAKIDQDFQASLDEQVHLSRTLARASPFSCFALAATALTNTGLEGKRRFLDQVRAFQATITVYAHQEAKAQAEYRIQNRKRPPSWREARKNPMPVFTYVKPKTTGLLRLTILDAGLLLGIAVVFFMLSYITFLRYDVR